MRRTAVAFLAATSLLSCGGANDNASRENATLEIDSSVTFQTWRGWAGRAVTDVQDPARSAILDAAASDLGITAIGIPARFKPGNENPGVIGWDSVATMTLATRWAAPFQSRAGSDFTFTIRAEGEPGDKLEIVRVLNALKTLNLVPDVWIVENEPDIGARISAQALADSIASTCAVFQQRGLATKVSTPALSTVAGSLAYAQVLRNDARLTGCLGEWSFHQYGQTSRSDLEAFGTLSTQTGLPSRMDEHHGAAITELMDDIELANISVWQRDGFAGNGCNSCYSLYSSPSGTSSFLAGNTGFYRQFSRAIRPGMVRWKVTSSNSAVRAVAFGAPGKAALVALAASGGSYSINGLPAGTYEISYVLGNGKWTGAGAVTTSAINAPNVTIAGGESLQATIPSGGVLSVRKIG